MITAMIRTLITMMAMIHRCRSHVYWPQPRWVLSCFLPPTPPSPLLKSAQRIHYSLFSVSQHFSFSSHVSNFWFSQLPSPFTHLSVIVSNIHVSLSILEFDHLSLFVVFSVYFQQLYILQIFCCSNYSDYYWTLLSIASAPEGGSRQ